MNEKDCFIVEAALQMGFDPHPTEDDLYVCSAEAIVEFHNRIKASCAGWQPIETAPKDGTIIKLTWLESGVPQEIWPMQWAHIQKNGLFPGKRGMWVAPDGSVTWNDDDPKSAPTHWMPVND